MSGGFLGAELAAATMQASPETLRAVVAELDAADITHCRLVASTHANGASVRTLARVFGYSRSTLHRELPAILRLAAYVPNGTGEPADAPDDDATSLSVAAAVPDGTADELARRLIAVVNRYCASHRVSRSAYDAALAELRSTFEDGR